MDIFWRIFTVVVAAMIMVSVGFMLRMTVIFMLPSPSVPKRCDNGCTPDNCACWDKEQKRRRADLDRQAMGGEDVRGVRISGSKGVDLH
jgi:hypothetical protein